MPGTQIFTYANLGKETVRGTAVPPTRQLYADGTAVMSVDAGLNFHEGENAGIRTRIRRATQTKEDVAVALRTVSGIGYDDLIYTQAWLKGGLTPVGAGADKTWTAIPSMTAANNPESFTLDVGDDVQNWRVPYLMATRLKLSAAMGDVTQWEADCFGKSQTKVAKAAPAVNSATKIVGDLWTIKFAATLAGLAGASTQTNFLQAWDLELQTGYKWRHYMDGTLQGSQHVETDISGTLGLTVESTALAVSEFYDKSLSQTMDFVRLKATGPTLGGTNYSAQLDVPVLWEVPQPIGSEDEGVNLWQVTGRLAYDSVSAQSIGITVVNSLTAIP